MITLTIIAYIIATLDWGEDLIREANAKAVQEGGEEE